VQRRSVVAYRATFSKHVALTSFNRRRHRLVCVGAYSLSNFRLGYDLGLGLGIGLGIGLGLGRYTID